jgi:lipopolysaccharide transport system permease protein
MPLSIVISNLLKFCIQFLIFVAFYIYYALNGMEVALTASVLLLPLLVILMGVLGLGLGMIISSMVTKYRDLTFLVSFGVQLLMYLSAVMYPMALLKEKLPSFGWLIEYNPLAYIVETSRYLLLHEGSISVYGMVYTVVITFALLLFGLLIFNKTEKSFIDTV